MRRPILASLTACLLSALMPAGAGAAGFPKRSADPVVLTGSKTPSLIGEKPSRIIAFRFNRGWHQVPVQVDQRSMVDYAAVRQGNQAAGRPFSHLAYSDPDTFAGADPDPMLDGDDEIAAMAADSGRSASGKDGKQDPRGVVKGSRERIKVSDPLQPDVERYMYLFVSKGKLKPSSGKSYVSYDFSLDSGDYKTTYLFGGVADDGNGPPANQEDSTVVTPYYSQHLLARWVEDELQIKAGDSTGVDILDGDKDQVGTSCGRSELTFSRGGGGFVANKSGPVRAIRSYIGANSGTFTQQDHIYYERSDVTKTYLRVHAGITTISQFLDYSPAATGMTYRNDVNPTGVTIDGNPDTLTAGRPTWEQVSGAQGSASIVNRVDTDLPQFNATNFYLDDSTPPSSPQQCGGYADLQAWGASGSTISSTGHNTDPTLATEQDPANFLTGTRTIFYGGPSAGASQAELRSDQVDSPLKAKVRGK